MQWFNIVLQGVLIGGLYAMFAAGLSLIFGVMRLVNIAHGDLIVLAAYVSLMVTQAIGVDPLVSPVCCSSHGSHRLWPAARLSQPNSR